MTASSAVATYGTTFTWNGHVIAEVQKIGDLSLKKEDIDVHHLQSANGYKEFIAGWGDGGTITIDCNLITSDADGQIAMATDYDAGTKRTAIITAPDSSWTHTFTGYINNLVWRFDEAGQLGFTATIKLSGKSTFGYTAADAPSGLVVTGNVSGPLTLTPTYAAAKYTYACDGASDASVTVTVTAAGADTITVNGSSVATTVPSSAIALTSGALTTITVVVGETGKVSRTYTIVVAGGSA
jgi:predicted secreted protein